MMLITIAITKCMAKKMKMLARKVGIGSGKCHAIPWAWPHHGQNVLTVPSCVHIDTIASGSTRFHMVLRLSRVSFMFLCTVGYAMLI
jgi:hypothetical protein